MMELEILWQQEGFRLDPEVCLPVKMAGAGPSPERGCAVPFSEAPLVQSLWLCVCT